MEPEVLACITNVDVGNECKPINRIDFIQSSVKAIQLVLKKRFFVVILRVKDTKKAFTLSMKA